MSALAMSRRCIRISFFCGSIIIIAGVLAPIRGDDRAAPRPCISRVTPPEAERAVEVSVAINPTNPDHLIAVSIARLAKHPGISDFAYVSTDAGKTWNAIPARIRIRRNKAMTQSHSRPTVWRFTRSFHSPAFGNLDRGERIPASSPARQKTELNGTSKCP